MTTIYDAVDVVAIPDSAETILAYIDGGYVTYPTVARRFPNARILTVTTTGDNAADICDVESGDATPAIAAEGVRMGRYPTVYSAISTHTALVAAMEGPWQWYAADPTGTPHLVPGSVATQWAWPDHGSPGNFDISETNGIYPGTPEPLPAPTEGSVTEGDELMAAMALDLDFAVRYAYLFLLVREPDPAGFALFVNYLNGGGTLNQMWSSIADSPEGQNVTAAKRRVLGI